MQNLIPLIIIGIFVYLIFSRKGGMGCCGGHSTHTPKRHQDGHLEKSSYDPMEKVIDLRKDEYTVQSSKILPSAEANKRDSN